MRLPGAALLIVIGLVVLWAAITGKLDRMAAAWDFVKGEDAALPAGGAATIKPVINSMNNLLHTDSYHVAALDMQLNSPGQAVNLPPGGQL